MKRVEFDEKCKACHGTGLYIGVAERHGVAVVCHDCKGTGKFHFVHEYEEFNGREEIKNVKRVIETNPGICCGEIAGDVNWVGGMTYADWLRGKRFETGMEMRAHTCPAWWYQCADYTKKPDWKECWSANMFSACKYFGDKHKCWERWDKEFRNKQ